MTARRSDESPPSRCRQSTFKAPAASGGRSSVPPGQMQSPRCWADARSWAATSGSRPTSLNSSGTAPRSFSHGPRTALASGRPGALATARHSTAHADAQAWRGSQAHGGGVGSHGAARARLRSCRRDAAGGRYGVRMARSTQSCVGGETPLDLLDTDIAARMVADVLGRIAYGVYI